MAACVAVQGSRGCFSQQAAEILSPGARVVFCGTMADAFQHVVSRECDAVAVPVHNTTAGDIREHLDLVVTHEKTLKVRGETSLPVRMHLLGTPGATLEDVTTAWSHVVALKQCSRFFREHPHVKAAPFFDTAGAAKAVSLRKQPNMSAVAGELAAQVYGLDVIARDIHDSPDNATRFLLLGA